jgi:hypothetical protein
MEKNVSAKVQIQILLSNFIFKETALLIILYYSQLALIYFKKMNIGCVW